MNWNFFREILFYSFWIFLAAITEQFYWNSGQWALGIFQGTTMVAIFSLAIQLKGMFYLFSSAISSVFLPKVTRMVTSNTTAKRNIGFIHKNRTNPICGNIVHYSGFCDIRKIIYNPLGR